MPNLLTGPKYFEGMPAYTEEVTIRHAHSTFDGVIAAGKGVIRGAADETLTLPSATGGYFLGVAMLSDTYEKREGYSIDADGKFGWPENYTVSYVRRGVIAVPIDSDCVQGGAVYLIHTASTGQVPGHFRKDADTDAADLVPNAVFWKTLTEAGVGLIALNLP